MLRKAIRLVVLSVAVVAGCAVIPEHDPYVPAVAPPSPEAMSRDARIARARALELPTEYVTPPGDVMSHHAAGLARVLCAAVFITGLDADFATQNNGYLPPFEVRERLGKPVVEPSKGIVQIAAPGGAVRTAQFLGGKEGCAVYNEGESALHFTPSEPTSSLPAGTNVPWPIGDAVPRQQVPSQIDAEKLKQGVNMAFEPDSAMTAALVVTWRGQIIAERYASGITPQTALESWSMGKTVVGVLIGMLIQDGTYDLWKRAPIPEWQQAGDAHHDIRIADLLRMSSGLRFRGSIDAEPYPDDAYVDGLYVYTASEDVVHYVVTRPTQWPAGTVGRYRNSDAVVVAYLVRRAAESRGQNFYSFAQRALFDKLGIRTLVIEPDAYGNPLAHGYVLASARDWARLGNLLLQNGQWNGERLLPEAFVRFMRTPAPAWAADGRQWYGGFVWLNRGNLWPGPEDSYALVGAGGQSTVIFPTHDLVVVRMGHARGEQAGSEAAERALKLILEAVPQSRPVEPSYSVRP